MKTILRLSRQRIALALGWSLLLGSALALPAQTPTLATVDDLAWLAGAWTGRSGGTDTEEHWLPPKGGLMLGVNRSVREGRRASFEFLRLATTTNGVSYFASPQGRPAAEFPLKELSARKVVFENPKHDFPQRIIYRLEEDRVLHARIEGIINGSPRSQEWRWEKAKSAP